MTIDEMNASRNQKIDEATAIEKTARDEGKEITPDEEKKIDTLLDQADTLEKDVAKAEIQDRSNRLSGHRNRIESAGARKTSPESSVPIKGDGEGGGEAVTPGLNVGPHNSTLDEKMNGFRSHGEFFAAVRNACPHIGHGAMDNRLQPLAAASGMNQAIGSEGGFAVLPEFSRQIWDGMNQVPNNLLSMTENFTINGESLTIPANAEVSKATGSRFGGVQGFFISEADQITSSKPKLRQVRLEPHQLAVLIFVTDKLLNNEDTALGQYITRAATDEINFLVGDAIVNGSGVGKPLGFLQSNSLVTVAKESGQAANTVLKANIDKMFSRLHFVRRAGAVWLINQDIEPQLMGLNTDTTNGIPVFLPGGMMRDQPLATLLGRPILPIEYTAALGTVGDIIFADMKGYTTGTRGSIDTAMSMHLRFDFAETAFRFMFSVDGQTWLQEAIQPFKGSDKRSSFVALETRA